MPAAGALVAVAGIQPGAFVLAAVAVAAGVACLAGLYCGTVPDNDGFDPGQFDINVAHPARMYDYYLGGKTHFAADRAAAGKVLEALPEGRDMAIANRGLLARVIPFLAAEGITQFLDIGTGIPSPGNTSEIVHGIVPDARVVCADNDPLVVEHARALLRDGGPVSVVHGDLRDPKSLLADAAVAPLFDSRKPVAVLLVAVLHFIRDQEDPERIVEVLKEAMPPGSYLVISHGTQDFNPDRATAAVRGYDQATAPFVLRSRDQVSRLFDGLDMVEPGLVPLPFWRPDGKIEGDPSKIWLYAGVGRKP
jgi:hypothetical protein